VVARVEVVIVLLIFGHSNDHDREDYNNGTRNIENFLTVVMLTLN